jgi:hypothetical protein
MSSVASVADLLSTRFSGGYNDCEVSHAHEERAVCYHAILQNNDFLPVVQGDDLASDYVKSFAFLSLENDYEHCGRYLDGNCESDHCSAKQQEDSVCVETMNAVQWVCWTTYAHVL